MQRTDWSLAPTRQVQMASTRIIKATVLIFSVLFWGKKKERGKSKRKKKPKKYTKTSEIQNNIWEADIRLLKITKNHDTE